MSIDPNQPEPKTSDTNMPPPGGGGDIPTLNDIVLNFFTVSPTAIKAGDIVDIRWSATVPSTLGGVVFHMGGLTVGASGHQHFRPVVNTVYGLTAERYGAYRSMASQAVTVDPSPCTLPGVSKPLVDIEFFVQLGVFDALRVEKNYTISTSGVTLRIREDLLADTKLELEAGLLKLTVPLTITIDSVPGDGTLTARVWFQLLAQGGLVMALNTRTETDLNLPWGTWLVGLMALLGPVGAFLAPAIIGVLNGVGPDLAAGNIKGALGPIAALISQPFGDRVSSVSTGSGTRNPGDDPEPFIFTTVCP